MNTDAVAAIAIDFLRQTGMPGVVLSVAEGVEPPVTVALGVDARGVSLLPMSLAPVASISKLGCALALLRLVAQGACQLDDPLVMHLPEAAAAQSGVTLRRLLTHTSGAPVDVAGESAPYQVGLSWATIRRACLQTPLQSPPGQVVRYSNLDMGLIAIVIERLTGLDYPLALRNLVLKPLRIEAWLGEEPPRPVAAVDGSLGKHGGTDLEPFNSAFWRSLGFPWGSLITNMEGALRLVLGFRAADFLPAPLAAEAIGDQTSPLPGGFLGWLEWSPCAWGIGAEVMGHKSPHYAATRASMYSYGHVGATGALAWCDPEADLAWALFAPRTWETWWRDMSRIGDALLLQVG